MSILFNTEEFKKSLIQACKGIENKVQDNMELLSEEMLEEARSKAPVDIGTMKENSDYSVKNEGNSIEAVIGFMEFYSVYVHQGTGLFALNGDGRQTAWWWKGSTPKWEGWHKTHGQAPKQFLWDTYVDYIPRIPLLLAKDLM